MPQHCAAMHRDAVCWNSDVVYRQFLSLLASRAQFFARYAIAFWIQCAHTADSKVIMRFVAGTHLRAVMFAAAGVITRCKHQRRTGIGRMLFAPPQFTSQWFCSR